MELRLSREAISTDMMCIKRERELLVARGTLTRQMEAPMPLTDVKIKSARPTEKPYKLYDERGLFLIVPPTGGKWWRLKYRFDDKEKLLSLGVYPDIGLRDARDNHREIRFITSFQEMLGLLLAENCRFYATASQGARCQAMSGQQVLARDEPVAGARIPWKHSSGARPDDLIRAKWLALVQPARPVHVFGNLLRGGFADHALEVSAEQTGDPRPRSDRTAFLHLSIALVDSAMGDVGFEADDDQFRHAE